MDDFDP